MLSEVNFEVGPGVVFFGALRVLTMELVFVLVRFEMVSENLVRSELFIASWICAERLRIIYSSVCRFVIA